MMEQVPIVNFGYDTERDVVVLSFVQVVFMSRKDFNDFLDDFIKKSVDFATACEAIYQHHQEEQEARQKVQTAQAIEAWEDMLKGVKNGET